VTTTTSRVPEVIDYLVATAQAASALTGVLVLDGPQIPAAWQTRKQVLWFGADPASLGEAAGESAQDFATAMSQGKLKDELGSILCAARHWSGDKTSKTHRDGAAAIVAAVELMLRSTPDAGGPGDATMGGLVFWSQVGGQMAWFPKQVTNGAECLVTFHVTYMARLTT